jgi:hypothetical protein
LNGSDVSQTTSGAATRRKADAATPRDEPQIGFSNGETNQSMFYIINPGTSPFHPTPEGRQIFISQALFAINGLRAEIEQKPFDHSSGTKEDVIQLPKFAADFVAVIRIAQWEKSGEKKYLDQSLPQYEQALGDLEARVLSTPDAFFGEDPATTLLHELVADATSRSFHFNVDLEAVMLVVEPDESALIDAIAQLLWDRTTALTKKESKDV